MGDDASTSANSDINVKPEGESSGNKKPKVGPDFQVGPEPQVKRENLTGAPLTIEKEAALAGPLPPGYAKPGVPLLSTPTQFRHPHSQQTVIPRIPSTPSPLGFAKPGVPLLPLPSMPSMPTRRHEDLMYSSMEGKSEPLLEPYGSRQGAYGAHSVPHSHIPPHSLPAPRAYERRPEGPSAPLLRYDRAQTVMPAISAPKAPPQMGGAGGGGYGYPPYGAQGFHPGYASSAMYPPYAQVPYGVENGSASQFTYYTTDPSASPYSPPPSMSGYAVAGAYPPTSNNQWYG